MNKVEKILTQSNRRYHKNDNFDFSSLKLSGRAYEAFPLIRYYLNRFQLTLKELL